MEILIDDNRTLQDLQEEFSAKYPFLKLEFFSKAHAEGDASPKSEMITENHKLGEVRTNHKQGSITIHSEMKVSDLENDFEDLFGIHIQVFRKSGDLWLETSATDSWSLKEQNSTGEEMS